MTTSNPDNRDRYLESLTAAVSDLRSAQAELLEAQRLGNKYGVGDRGVLADGLARVDDVAARLARLAGSTDTGSACFPGSALVATPSGDRRIETVQAGDSVLSWSTVAGTLRTRVVTRVTSHSSRDLIIVRALDGHDVTTTANHRFLTDRGWTRADRLRRGDLVRRVGGAGNFAEVLEVANAGRREPVHNLITAGEHTYVVDGFVAHNFTHLPRLRTWLHRTVMDRISRARPGAYDAACGSCEGLTVSPAIDPAGSPSGRLRTR